MFFVCFFFFFFFFNFNIMGGRRGARAAASSDASTSASATSSVPTINEMAHEEETLEHLRREMARGPAHWKAIMRVVARVDPRAASASEIDVTGEAVLVATEAFARFGRSVAFVDARPFPADPSVASAGGNGNGNGYGNGDGDGDAEAGAEAKVARWLASMLAVFLDACRLLLAHRDTGLRAVALRALMDALRGFSASAHPATRACFPDGELFAIAAQLWRQPPASLSATAVDVAQAGYLDRDDLRYHLMTSLTAIADAEYANSEVCADGTAEMRALARLDLLRRIGPPRVVGGAPFVAVAAGGGGGGGEDSAEGNGRPPYTSLRRHRKAYAAMWTSFLRRPLTEPVLARVLADAKPLLIDAFPRPARLVDFFMAAYSHGGLVGLMSLEGVFTLITKHNLDYPAFFDRVYALLGPDALAGPHRAQFLRLLDVSLRSSYIAEHVVAAFAKKLARLCLTAPPAGILAALPVVYNLLRRHPACRRMVARPPVDLGKLLLLNLDGGSGGGDELKPTAEDESSCGRKRKRARTQAARVAGGSGVAADESTANGLERSERQRRLAGAGQDPFDEHSATPAGAQASDSSLWELASLQSHYHAAVARMARAFFVEIRPADMDVAEFAEMSYASLMRAELRRRPPAGEIPVAFAEPAAFFSSI
jgi:hypothetical protein